MSIISQDGTIDVPYENSIVFRDDEYILYLICGSDTGKITGRLLASYRTPEKAEKAMEMLREEYGKHFYGQGGAMATENFYVPPFAFIPPKVFQFQKYEDLEV